ncbi:MAG: tripartite tricarboxylate transporter permease [Thermodesulfobacteriota bacterium]
MIPNMAMLVFSPPIIGIELLGTMLGIFVGITPGLTGVMGMALMLGFAFRIPMEWGLALLIAIYTAAIFSGGITATMMNIPGTPAAAATCLDGFPLAKRGKAREAIGAVTIASGIGELLGELFTLFSLPFIFIIALKFGDWEVFLACMVGVLVCGSLAGKEVIKGWISGILGLLIAMVGMEEIWAYPRFAYHEVLIRGFNFVPALIGLFGISEVLVVLKEKIPYQLAGKPGRAIIPFGILKKNVKNIIRSALVGIGIGCIPGIGESASCWVSYDLAYRASKRKDDFGKGSFEGIIAAEVANNATSGGALIPTLVLGIPGSGPTAILLAALFIYGVRPGPMLMVERPGFVTFIVLLFWLSAIMIIFAGLLLSSYVIRLLSIRREIILPIATAMSILGAWGSGFTHFDIASAFAFGLVGYIMKLKAIPVAPMVLGILIGNIADTSLRRALLTYMNDPLAMLFRPIGIGLMILLFIMLFFSLKKKKGLGMS